MERKSLQKAKQCSSREHDWLLENLSICDRFFKNSAERYQCYRVAAKISGHRSKKCIAGE